MRCQYHSRKCIECDEHLQVCNDCANTELDCGESFRYCTEPKSKYCGDCVEDAAVCCQFFKSNE